MKFKVSSSKLHAILQVLGKVVSQKNTVPSLESILFEVKDNKLYLTASDGETRMETNIDLDKKEGDDISFIAKPKFLLDPLREIPDQIVSFEVNDTDYHTIVSYLNGQFVFRAETAETYPQMEEMNPDLPSFTLPVDVLEKGLRYTMFATSNDTSRPITMGIFIEGNKDGICFVGTDGFLLSTYNNKSASISSDASFIMSKKPAQLLHQMISRKQEDEDSLSMRVGKKHVAIETSRFTLYASLVAGNFPNYRSVIPSTTPNVMEVDREKFLAVIRRVSMFSDKSFGMVSIDLKADEAVLRAADQDIATSADEKITVSYKGIEQVIAFRSGHLIDVMNNFDASSEITFSMGDKSTPALVSPMPQPEGEELMALVMPLMQ